MKLSYPIIKKVISINILAVYLFALYVIDIYKCSFKYFIVVAVLKLPFHKNHAFKSKGLY